MISLAGVVVLYYPDADVIPNVKSYCAFLKKVYVFDNSENRNETVVQKINELPNAAYFNDGENKGIAKRLNQAAAFAKEEGFDWLLTMDQDSSFSSESFTTYMRCFLHYPDSASVAMFGIEFEKTSSVLNCDVVPLNRLITSGSLLNLTIWSTVGGFDELLFIDEVDLEYCYRSILAGFRILKFPNIYLNHSLGEISMHRSIKNLAVTQRTLHSPLRVYYMIRNHLYVNGKYKASFAKDIAVSRNDLVNRIKNNLLYGKNRWLLIKLMLQAVADYRSKRMGKK